MTMTRLTYQKLEEYLEGRTERLIKRSQLQTRAVRWTNEPGQEVVFSIYLVETEIMQFWPDGSVWLSADGWMTHTTKARLNDYLPPPWTIYQNGGVWYLSDYRRHQSCPFANGMVIMPDGEVAGCDQDKIERDKALLKQIRKYAAGFITAMQAGEVGAPGPGDCWLCGLHGKDIRAEEHLLPHFEQEYYVPRLLKNALDETPHVSSVVQWWVGDLWAGRHDRQVGWDEEARRQVKKILVHYLKSQFGLAR